MKKFLLILSCILLTLPLLMACDRDKGESSNSAVVEKNFSTDELTETVRSVGEWPSMVKVEDNEMAMEFFKLDLENENYEEISILQTPMSGALAEIIIINPSDGKLEGAKYDLKERREKLIEVDAFYPSHQVIAEESIIGDAGDYVYLIVGTDAVEGEKALLDKLGK